MKRQYIHVVFIVSVVLIFTSCTQQSDFPVLERPYLGQKQPGMTPEIFAPGIVYTEDKNHSCVAISPDGKEMYWSLFSVIDSVRQERIWFTEIERGKWTPPRVAPFSGEYRDGQPSFSPDGKSVYFSSLRPTGPEDVKSDANIWIVHKTRTGWS